MDMQIKNVKLADLTVGKNHRVGKSLQVEEMANSIKDLGGITNPIVVWKNPESKKLEVCQGHRRRLGLIDLSEHEPDVFKSLFPAGIPVIVRADIKTAAEAAMLKADHGTTVTLGFKCERNRAVADLIEFGTYSEKEIISRCEGLFAKFANASSAEKRAKIEQLRKEDPIGNRKAIREMVHGMYKGQYQQAKAVHDNPSIVRACLEHIEAGEPLPPKAKCPAKLTYTQVRELATVMLEECKEVDVEGLPKYSKANPGPKWRKAWDDILNQKLKEESKQPKSMSAKSMLNQLETGVWASKGFQKLTQQHAGKEVTGLQEADKMLYLVELVKTHEPKMWADFVKVAEGIRQKSLEGTL